MRDLPPSGNPLGGLRRAWWIVLFLSGVGLSLGRIFVAVALSSLCVGAQAAEPTPSATPAPKRQDLIARVMGGSVDKVTSEYDTKEWSARSLLDDRPTTEPGWCSEALSSPKDFPQELVFSFFAHQPALISAVVINAETREPKNRWSKEIEIWVSMDGPDTGFSKLAETALANEPGEQTISLTPTQARFVKLRLLSNYGDSQYFALGKVKVIEGAAPGYVPLVQRYPDLAALVGGAEPEAVFAARPESSAVPTSSPSTAPSACDCAPPPPAANLNPAHPESRKVLVITDDAKTYAPTTYKSTDKLGHVDYSIYGRISFVVLAPERPRASDLLRANEFDTVVLSQVCKTKERVPEDFKRALPAWIAAGHKLIIQDSDDCPGKSPDYSFLPYPFTTGNAGATGTAGDRLIFVEENRLANSREGDAGFLNVEKWLKSIDHNSNELGDSNVITRYDPHWCGHLFTTNAKRDNGFVEAYAQHGRGLIIYDGFDEDQRDSAEYRQLVTRELAQPFDPDGLPCGARLGDFLITTEPKLRSQPMVPGKTYTYPLTLLSNQGYKGDIKLTFKSEPVDPSLTPRFDSETIQLTEISNTNLVVTTTNATPPGPHLLQVTGTDAEGKCSSLCLQWTERATGGLRVRNDHRTSKPSKAARNLEIILDLSGSMKARLGTSTRVDTARKVLAEVLSKIPDDFSVGLRFYGHRYGSRQKETCTDTELVAPIAKMNRPKLLSLINSTKPRGETPLVYSVLQTPADLQAVGGGSVILITDGEESCGGDPQKAAEELKKAGVDITVDIVGFTLTGQKVQGELTQFAEATGGRYFRAENAQTLARALMIAATDKIPYDVYDASGKKVATGEAGDQGQELPPGDYQVVVKAGDQRLVAEHVTVTQGKDAAITVTVKNYQFELEGP